MALQSGVNSRRDTGIPWMVAIRSSFVEMPVKHHVDGLKIYITL
jgi:hypothetical protein